MTGREHHLKTLEPYWTEVAEGRKTFEYRFNDRGYQAGDVLHLYRIGTREGGVMPTTCKPGECRDGTHWRESVSFRVGFVLSAAPRMPLGEHVVLSLLPLEDS